MIWIILSLLPLAYASDVVCPGGSYQCPDTATCCELPDKTYGCCPLKNAVCCDDHIHCCPQGSKCDAGMCIQNTYENSTAEKLAVKSKNHPCPSEESSCLENYTCCSDPSSSLFGCCPLPNAVCCQDVLHCCPHSTVCDLISMRCVDKGFISQMYDTQKEQYEPKKSEIAQFAKITASEKIVSNVICPGDEFQCPNGYTCCKLPAGNWGCCPVVNATCCNDHLHCCPQNMKCDPISKFCIQGLKNVTWFSNTEAKKILEGSIICPDKRQCHEPTTCCKLESGNYGCCYYANAVCCSDHLHCCPNGYECDVKGKQCVHKNNWVSKLFSKYDDFFARII